jgi:hypothetical protein
MLVLSVSPHDSAIVITSFGISHCCFALASAFSSLYPLSIAALGIPIAGHSAAFAVTVEHGDRGQIVPTAAISAEQNSRGR